MPKVLRTKCHVTISHLSITRYRMYLLCYYFRLRPSQMDLPWISCSCHQLQFIPHQSHFTSTTCSTQLHAKLTNSCNKHYYCKRLHNQSHTSSCSTQSKGCAETTMLLSYSYVHSKLCRVFDCDTSEMLPSTKKELKIPVRSKNAYPKEPHRPINTIVD